MQLDAAGFCHSDFIVDARSKLESGHRPTPVGDKPKDRELHRLSAQRHSQSETALETLKEALAATNFSSQAEKTKADGGSHDEEDDFFDVGASVGGSGGGSGLASGPGHVDGYRKSEHTNRTAAPATTGRPRNHSELPRKADQSAERYKSLDYYPFDPSHPIGKHNHRNRSMPSIHADSGLYGMRVFANSQFAAQKRGFLRRKVPLEEMISYTNETIARPLMNLPREMTRDAVRSFRAIQRYMGDIDEDPTFEENFAEVLWLANQGIRHQMLRDEVFCQIAKQVTGNPDASAAEKGWALMGVLLYAFRPTQLLLPHLEAFIDATAISSTYLKRFLKLQINRVKRTGSRTSQMSKKELRLAMTVPSRPMIFGATLAEIMGNKDLIGRDSGLPLILEQLTQLITKLGGERTEGLFRVPGDSDAVSIARLQIEAGQPDFSSIHDPNIPASLLKEWLRDLAEPLMPESMYEACIEKPDDPQAVQSILYMLPDSSYQVVKYILGFLSHLLQPNIRDATKMDSSNLALVFGPSFLRNPVSDLKDVFANSSREQKFVMTLLESFMDS
ncbi:hypothetical protein GGI12_001256 [Dipsacomyces acuminosporus]|nr:hypothetical protein GGI12_001256 [Dipsacomyces acuminosporus]